MTELEIQHSVLAQLVAASEQDDVSLFNDCYNSDGYFMLDTEKCTKCPEGQKASESGAFCF